MGTVEDASPQGEDFGFGAEVAAAGSDVGAVEDASPQGEDFGFDSDSGYIHMLL